MSKQYLISTSTPKDWREWHGFALAASMGIVRLQGVSIAEVQLRPELIFGVLRRGHKLMISGPSKAGKSYCLIAQAIALGLGLKWLGWQCVPSRVLYVNLEIDGASMLHRFDAVAQSMGVEFADLPIDVLNLRGRIITAEILAGKLEKLAADGQYDAIIIDPAYKIQSGVENAAEDIAKFCNILDKIAEDTGAAVIYCTHHSKGNQSNKSSIDRASGSGVFARDADAIIDLCPVAKRSHFEIEATLREFKSPQPRIFEFVWPIHREVTDPALLAKLTGSKATRLQAAIEDLGGLGIATVADVADALSCSTRTIQRQIKNDESLTISGGVIHAE